MPSSPGNKRTWLPSCRPPGEIAAGYFARLPLEARVLGLGLGKGSVVGWLSVDGEHPWHSDVLWDPKNGLPFLPDASISAIYSEHFLHRIPRAAAQALMADCHRVLRPGGRIRIAMPDADAIVERYFEGRSTPPSESEFSEVFGELFGTPGEDLNAARHAARFGYLYNLEDATILLRRAGFERIQRCGHGVSDIPALAGRERRSADEAPLIVEAEKL